MFAGTNRADVFQIRVWKKKTAYIFVCTYTYIYYERERI